MADLDRGEIMAIAELARLALDDAEVAQLQRDLGSILAHMAALAEVDTTGVEPMTHAVPMDLRLRDDDVEPSLSQERALAAAPDRRGDELAVPQVLRAKE